MEPAPEGATAAVPRLAALRPVPSLGRRSEFRRVYDTGRRVSGACVQLFALPNDAGRLRLGITVTKRVGGAVVRNRVRRRIREVFRTEPERATLPFDVVVNVRHDAGDASFDALRRDLGRLLERLARAPAS